MIRIPRPDCWYLKHIELHVMSQLLKTTHSFLPWTQCLVFVGPEMERSSHMKQSQCCSKRPDPTYLGAFRPAAYSVLGGTWVFQSAPPQLVTGAEFLNLLFPTLLIFKVRFVFPRELSGWLTTKNLTACQDPQHSGCTYTPAKFPSNSLH